MGLRTPKGDKTRGMLLTDTKHRVDIALLNADGSPAGDGEVEVKLYKVDWRWWWEKGEENLAAWADASVHTPLQSGVVKVTNGAGAWELEIKYPDWGRYLRDGGGQEAPATAPGKTLYIDWPGWAGRGQKEGGGGASVLAFAADKPEYAPGETVTLAIPTPQKGRGLVSLESGSRVLQHRVDRGQGAGDALHVHRHGRDGAERLRPRDAAAAARADRQRPADPALRHRPGQGGEPADAAPAGPRGARGAAAGDDLRR